MTHAAAGQQRNRQQQHNSTTSTSQLCFGKVTLILDIYSFIQRVHAVTQTQEAPELT